MLSFIKESKIQKQGTLGDTFTGKIVELDKPWEPELFDEFDNFDIWKTQTI